MSLNDTLNEAIPGDYANMKLEMQMDKLTLPSLLYFCVPHNDMLLGYWDTVADRLFKIRYCMNIEGLVRELPLFEPPIDPFDGIPETLPPFVSMVVTALYLKPPASTEVIVALPASTPDCPAWSGVSCSPNW